MKTPNSQKRNTSHIYRQVRDIVCNDVANNLVHSVSTNASGTASSAFILHPKSLISVTLSGTTFEPVTVDPPHLPWLHNAGNNFARYRILNAKLVFVGSVGSTATGTIVLATFTNSIDANSALQLAYAQGNYVKTFDLARASGKELVVPMPVDSSWKNISSALLGPGSTHPFSSSQSSIVPYSTVDALCFGAFSYTVVGAPASATLGQFFIVYDVEFKDPIALSLNK